MSEPDSDESNYDRSKATLTTLGEAGVVVEVTGEVLLDNCGFAN